MGDAELLSLIEKGKNIAAFLVAIGVAGEFAGDFMAGPINKRREEARQTEMVRLVAISDSARKDAAEANERASANEKEAKRLGKLATDEQIARLQLEERVAPRRVTDEQKAQLLTSLRRIPHLQVNFTSTLGDSESEQYAFELMGIFNEAGWNPSGIDQVQYNAPAPRGVGLQIGPADVRNPTVSGLQNALRAVDINAPADPNHPGLTAGRIEFAVFFKPLPAIRGRQ